MKIGDKVVCVRIDISDGRSEITMKYHLTINKIYEVIDFYRGSSLTIKNDVDTFSYYNINNFKLLSDIREDILNELI